MESPTVVRLKDIYPAFTRLTEDAESLNIVAAPYVLADHGKVSATLYFRPAEDASKILPGFTPLNPGLQTEAPAGNLYTLVVELGDSDPVNAPVRCNILYEQEPVASSFMEEDTVGHTFTHDWSDANPAKTGVFFIADADVRNVIPRLGIQFVSFQS